MESERRFGNLHQIQVESNQHGLYALRHISLRRKSLENVSQNPFGSLQRHLKGLVHTTHSHALQQDHFSRSHLSSTLTRRRFTGL